MKSRKMVISNQPSKQPQKCRLPAAYSPAYVPLTPRLRLPLTLPRQKARRGVFCQPPYWAILASENARIHHQEALRRVQGQVKS